MVQSDPSEIEPVHADRALAQRAAAGDLNARATITKLVDPLVQAKTTLLCKRYCRDNRYRAACTLDRNWGRSPADFPFCEWGNASYAQLFAELVKPEVLRRYEARGGCSLRDFLRTTLHSLGVTERWKDMRFGRRISVPECVEKLGSDARRLFLWMCDHDTIPNMAQRLNKPQAEIEALVRSIFDVLIAAGCSYTLQPPTEISTTEFGTNDDDEDTAQLSDGDIPAALEDYAQIQLQQRVLSALEQLDGVSRFVLKAKFWEDLPMQDILDALKAEGVSIREGVAPAQTTLNQLYYFYYQALTRLKESARL